MSKDRAEIFSDAVFAIILTLLVLELHVPVVADHSSISEYASAMSPVIPKIISFVLTFILICIHWVTHHYFFSHIIKTPIGLIWLNNFFLLILSFMPFPTAMLGDHPTDQFPILLYGINQLLAAITFFTFRAYASRKKLFLDKETSDAMGPSHSIPALAFFSLAIIFAFINVYLSLACFLIVPLIYFIPNLMHTK